MKLFLNIWTARLVGFKRWPFFCFDGVCSRLHYPGIVGWRLGWDLVVAGSSSHRP